MAVAGMRQGLEPGPAMQLARQTVIGAAALLEADPSSAATLRENVTSPKGTTAAALVDGRFYVRASRDAPFLVTPICTDVGGAPWSPRVDPGAPPRGLLPSGRCLPGALCAQRRPDGDRRHDDADDERLSRRCGDGGGTSL